MMKFPNFGQRRSNQNSIDSVSNAEAPIQTEEALEDEMVGLSAEEAAEIRDAFNVILQSDQDPMVETATDIEGELAAEPEFLVADAVEPIEPTPVAVEPTPMAVEPTVDSPSLMSKLDLDITPLVLPTVLSEPIEQLNPYELSQDLALTEEADVDLDLVDLDLTVDAVDTGTGETEAAAPEDSSYDIHTDGPLTYFQYYLDGESSEAAEYNPVSLRRPSMPTGLVGAGILGAALVSGFSIADAMKQSQPVAKRPTPSPLQDLKNQASPPPVVPAPPESLQPEVSALPPAPQVNRAALGAGPVGGSANLPIVPPPAPATAAISQPTYSLQQGGAAVTSIAPVSNLPQINEPPAPIREVQTPVNNPPASNLPILPPPPLPSGILSEPQPVVVSNMPVPAAPEVSPAAQPGAANLQPVQPQTVTPEVISKAPEMSQPKVAPQEVGILPSPGLPSAGPTPAKLPEVQPASDRLSRVTPGIKETGASGNELIFDRKPMPPGAIEQAGIQPAQTSALQSLLTPPQNRGFLADEVTLRSLSQQEANLLTQANGIEPFTKRTLTIRDYVRAYQVASKQVNGLPPFGFIDYQQKTITLPDESSTASVASPTGVPQS